MGSELRDSRSNRPLWGIGSALLTAGRVGYRERLRALWVSEEEREGSAGRVVTGRLLSVPDWLPGLGGVEPYGRLEADLRDAVLHPDAVLSFAYDWRLGIDRNATLLARAARAHLKRWRTHPASLRPHEERRDDRLPRLVVVAHSMGGLLVRAMQAYGDDEEPLDIRAVITLGTPFEGSVKALQLINTGAGAPLRMPATATRDACRTMPGLYDLLPWYRCHLSGDDVVNLTPHNLASVGGDPALVEGAFRRRNQTKTGILAGHVAVVGTGQRTAQSVEIRGGEVIAHPFGFRRDSNGELIRERGRLVTENHDGDGEVFRHAARTTTTPGIGFAQQHRALVRARAALQLVHHSLTEVDDLGTVLGGTTEDLGLDVADEVRLGEQLEIGIRGTDPARVSCSVEDTGRRDAVVARPVVKGRPVDGVVTGRAVIDRPGLYRVVISAGSDQVTKLVMCGSGDVLRD